MNSYLNKVWGALHNLCIFFRHRYEPNDLGSGIKKFEHIRSRILEKERISPDLISLPYYYEPILFEKSHCSLETADRQLFCSVMATRGDMSDLLLAESSDRCSEETNCR
jgi:hypothetical protein